MLPARNMSCASRAWNRIGPVVCRLSTMEVIVSPDTIAGSTQPMPLMIGFTASAPDSGTAARLAHPLGARGHHVLLGELIQQAAAQHPDQRRHPRHRNDDHRRPDPFQQIADAGDAPRGVDEIGREQPRYGDAEVAECEPQHHQCQQEAWHRQANEPEKGEGVVEPGVLAHRREDPHRHRHRVGDQQRQQRQHHRGDHRLADDLVHRAGIGQRPAEVAAQHHVADPLRVAHVERPVETVEAGQVLHFRRRQLGGGELLEALDVGGEEVAGGQLDQHEGDDRHRQDQRQEADGAPEDVLQHDGVPGRARAGRSDRLGAACPASYR